MMDWKKSLIISEISKMDKNETTAIKNNVLSLSFIVFLNYI
jgi:hypothetical protein